MQTVRDATVDVLRQHELTTVFANPGSTEVPFLTGLPVDLHFVLALHEGSVVGTATGLALARGQPALVLLHTTAGLGNAVGALATARVNRAPLVVLVGQQDRRHLAQEPFLAGQLSGLAGSYPVHAEHPVRAQDVPGTVARAWHEARHHRGPALVVVPMDDWDAPVDTDVPVPAPRTLARAPAVAQPEDVAHLRRLLEQARAPALVAGAGVDSSGGWAALTSLAERLACPVWQEAFGARAGFPQDHRLFAGHLPSERSGLREVLAPYDAVLVVGTAAFRQYPYAPGPLLPGGVRLGVVTDEPAEAHRSPADIAVLGDPQRVCADLAGSLPPRTDAPRLPARPGPPPPPAAGEALRATHVLAAIAARLPGEAVLVEETPSSRPDLHALVPARTPMGFLSAAMGGLGFAVPAAIGVRMGLPERPVVAVVGDGSAMYAVQALWTAAHYRSGVLIVVLSNGRYAVMDQLAAKHGDGGGPPWPPFEELRVATVARGLGCPAMEVDDLPRLEELFDEILPSLAERTTPLLLDVAVAPGAA